MTNADEKLWDIWNRALDYDVPATRDGDRALRDVLLMHGMAMNGGLLHAVEGLEPEELNGAVAGLRWLGLGELADGVAEFAVDAADVEELSDDDAGELEERGNDLYYGAVPDDDVIDVAFRRRYAEQPDAFAPVR